MSERAPEQLRPASNLDELRRQLEGGLESIESASPCYERLRDALRGSKWREQLWERPGLVAEVLARDASCAEALERGLRRAAQEGWHEDAPAVRTLREARARREQLVDRVRQLAQQLMPGIGAPTLEAGLRRLDAHAREFPTWKKRPEEAFVTLGGQVHWLGLPSAAEPYARLLLIVLLLGSLFILGVTAFFLFLITVSEGGIPALEDSLLVDVLSLPVMLLGGEALLEDGAMWWGSFGVALVLTGLSSVGLRRLRRGAVWLTPERLVWLPRSGEGATVRMDSIAEGGIRLHGGKGPLVVVGNRRVELPLGRWEAERLRLWLELFRHAELRARTARVQLPVEVVSFPAVLQKGMLERKGHAVLTGRNVYFLPEARAGHALLKAATGRTLDSRVELSWLLDMLRWQPEADFEALLGRAVEATQGVTWPASVGGAVANISWSQQVQLRRDNEVITGQLKGPQGPEAARIVTAWR
ncbi:hypothetical protein ACLESD_03910 [Pyxidicoccus sp. 3LFB2]